MEELYNISLVSVIVNLKFLRTNNPCSFHVMLSGIDCGPPPQIQDGSVQCSDTTSNGMAEYKCKKGFLLVGSSTMVCQSDGQTAKWLSLDGTNSAPVCKRTCYCLMCTIIWVELLLRCPYKSHHYSISGLYVHILHRTMQVYTCRNDNLTQFMKINSVFVSKMYVRS